MFEKPDHKVSSVKINRMDVVQTSAVIVCSMLVICIFIFLLVWRTNPEFRKRTLGSEEKEHVRQAPYTQIKLAPLRINIPPPPREIYVAPNPIRLTPPPLASIPQTNIALATTTQTPPQPGFFSKLFSAFVSSPSSPPANNNNEPKILFGNPKDVERYIPPEEIICYSA